MRWIKNKIYRLVPRNLRIVSKIIYYGKIVPPFIRLRNLIYYGKSDFFNILNIETTTYCNLRCKFCPNSIYDRGLLENKKLMETKLFKKIIDELSEVKFRDGIALHLYGEPLSDERLSDFVEYIKKHCPKVKTSINTNGFLLTIPIYQSLVKAGVSNILVSQYGNSIPPNCKKVLEYLKTRPKKENKLTYRIFGDSEDGSDAVYNRGGEIKLDKIPDLPGCFYPKKVIHIDFNGNILMCGQDYHSTIVQGNLNKEKLLEIWNKPSYRKLRKQFDKLEFHLEICKKCIGEIK
ncbi:MAG: radical SAM/SPASM domain-containing protein [archaeon]